MSREKEGSAVLLDSSHFEMENPWGEPVVGWVENSQGIGGLHNPRGYAMLRIVLQKLVDGVRRPLYDQPVIVENPGSVVIIELDGKVGLVQNFRMVSERILPDTGASYIKLLQKKKLWGKLIDSLGRWCWEAPKGLVPPKKEGESLIDFIIRNAKIEALEEAGFEIKDARIIGRVNVSPTFTPHSQFVVHANLKSTHRAQPESLEIIGKRQFFTMEELRKLNDMGEFDDGLTLAGLALCGMSLS